MFANDKTWVSNKGEIENFDVRFSAVCECARTVNKTATRDFLNGDLGKNWFNSKLKIR